MWRKGGTFAHREREFGRDAPLGQRQRLDRIEIDALGGMDGHRDALPV